MRLPRFTLFSGPHCSLCDVAKEELAVVRQKRPFNLDVISIRAEGQEKWLRKYVYEIPVLHLEDKLVAKGRWGRSEIEEALNKWETFYLNHQKPNPHLAEESEWYPDDLQFFELGDEVLGVEREVDTGRTRACFNCGSIFHVLQSCPERFDANRVAANRASFRALREDDDDGEAPFRGRFFEVALWREQRMEWLDTFKPGVIIGKELRDALGLRGGYEEECLPWFDGGNAEGSCGGMMFWGYPPGWVGEQDPQEVVRDRILTYGEESSLDIGEGISLNIVEDDHVEVLDIIKRLPPRVRSPTPPLSLPPSSPPPRASTHRWAIYNTTHFSSQLLPISNINCPLPPLRQSPTPPPTPPPDPKSTFTQDRKALWASLVAGAATPAKSGKKPAKALPPWRQPDGFDFRPRPPPGYIPPPPIAKPVRRPPQKRREYPVFVPAIIEPVSSALTSPPMEEGMRLNPDEIEISSTNASDEDSEVEENGTANLSDDGDMDLSE